MYHFLESAIFLARIAECQMQTQQEAQQTIAVLNADLQIVDQMLQAQPNEQAQKVCITICTTQN